MKIFSFLCFIICSYNVIAQNTCETSLPFCTDTVYNFPAGVNTGSAQSGPNYGCLYTQPNPAWYHLQIQDPGNIIIYMYTSPPQDIDFALWGPFSDPVSPCTAQLTASCTSCPNNTSSSSNYPYGNLVDCSYSYLPTETAHIWGAQTGEWYIMVITNYSNNPTNIIFEQQNSGQPNAGSTNCGILSPPITNNGPLCVGETLQLTANTVQGAIYYWQGPAGFTSNQQNPIITNVTMANAGTYTLSITVGTETSPPVSTIVVIHPNPTISVSNVDVCSGFNATLTASGAQTYVWSNGATTNPLVVTPSATSTYSVTGTDVNGCKNTASAVVTIHPNPDVQVVAEPSVICAGNSSTLTASGADIYTWIEIASNTNPVVVTPAVSTIYTVIGTNTATGCVKEQTVTVEVSPNPIVLFSANPTSGCEPVTVAFEDISGDSDIVQWYWQFGDGENSTIKNPTHTYNFDGSYDVELTVTNLYGCISTLKIDTLINIWAQPVADFYSVPEIGKTYSPVITFYSESIAQFWNWDFGDGNTSTMSPPVVHTYPDIEADYQVTLILSNEFGCSDTVVKIVQIIDDVLTFPNVITPNGDGYNDFFVITNGDKYPNNKLVVFNRWGKIVFEQTNYDNKWDGDSLAEGTYFYIFYYLDNAYNGSLTVIR